MDPRWIALRPSRRALALLAAGILLAGLALAWADPLPDLPVVWKALALVPVAAALFWEGRKLGHIGKGVAHAFYLIDLNDLADPDQPGHKQSGARLGIRLLVGPENTVQQGVVLEGAFVTPAFTAIPYRLEGDTAWRPGRMLSLWPDSLEREAFRALRVRLKWR